MKFWHIIEAVIMNIFLGLYVCFILLLSCSVYRGIYCAFDHPPPQHLKTVCSCFSFQCLTFAMALRSGSPPLRRRPVFLHSCSRKSFGHVHSLILQPIWKYKCFYVRLHMIIRSAPKFTANLHCICSGIDLWYTEADAVQIWGKFKETQ